MKITIIGAGIGGLCAGIALKRHGHEVRIFEQVHEILPVGAAISIWPNGVKCLNYLGISERIREIGGRLERMAYVDGLTGNRMTGFSLQPMIDRVGERAYPVSRADLQAVLLEAFGRADIRFGVRLEEIREETGSVTAVFDDGSTANSDLLIGADGAHSVARRYVTGKTMPRRYAGYVNWNGLIEIDDALAAADGWTTFVAEGKRVSFMPIAGNRFYFFFDVPLAAGLPNNRENYRQELAGHFSGWVEPVQKLIVNLDPMRTNRVEIHDIDPFSQWTKGRVALLGDAAHNTTPDIGQGGCMAMEDAVVLSMALQCHSLGVEDALARYQDRRTNRAEDLVLKARRRCDVTHAKDAIKTTEWYEELRRESGSNIIDGLVKTVEGGPFS